MGNVNYDSFYKFIVSLGIILMMLPFAVLIFLVTNSFDLYVTKTDLAQYSKTAQKVINWRQSLPLLIQEKFIWWIVGVCSIAGVALIIYGLKKWHELQKLDDLCKMREAEKQKEAIEKNTVQMSDEQIIQKAVFDEGPSTNVMKGFIIQQKFFEFIKDTKKEYIVKSNIMIGKFEYDVIAFSNKAFEKDYVYEVKYLKRNLSSHQIEQWREKMEKLKTNFSTMLNRIPYMTLTIIVPDEIYENALNAAKKVQKWNNYSIEILQESEL